MSHPNLSRRELLTAAAAGAAIAMTPFSAAQVSETAPRPPAHGANRSGRKRILRAAHITDVHIDGKRNSDRGLAQCLQRIAAETDPVSRILNTGDCVMCVNEVDEAEAKRQWGLFSSITQRESRVPIHSAIGNHDSWGWDAPSPDKPKRGKAMAMEVLGLKERYWRLDVENWTLLFLDSVFGSYTGLLDPPQIEWLKGQLEDIADKRPVCVLSHIPILTATSFFLGERFKDGNWTVPGSWMHGDAVAIKDLFQQHPNVRVCISGHMHQLDRVEYNGVTYVCGGAVSGGWWKGKYYNCENGYGLLDLFEDGAFEYRYNTYGWPTEAPAEA